MFCNYNKNVDKKVGDENKENEIQIIEEKKKITMKR
mgnify:CR=1 FL=1